MRPLVYRLLLAVLILLGAGLRLREVGLDGLYVDELHSLQLTLVSWSECARAILHHPPLFYLLLKGWREVAGDSLLALRLLPVCCGTVSLLLTAALARRLWGEQTALLATALATVSDLQIYFAREAKGYALLTALSLAAIYLLVRYLDERGRPALIGSTLCALGAMYTHYLGLLLPIGLAIFMIWRRPPGQGAWWSSQLIYLAYLPWAHRLWADFQSFAGMSHTPFTLNDLLWIGHDMLPGGLVSAGPIILLAAPLLSALWLGRRDPRLHLLLCGVAATGLLPVAASLAGIKLVEFARHLLTAHWLLLILIARGSLLVERSAQRRALVLGALACTALPLALCSWRLPAKEDWNAVSEYLERSLAPEDVLLVTDWHFLHDRMLLLYGGRARLLKLDPLPTEFSMKQRQEAWSAPDYFLDDTPLETWFDTVRDQLPSKQTLYVVVPDQPGHRRIHRAVLSLIARDPSRRAQVVFMARCSTRLAPEAHYCAAIFVVRLSPR